MIACPAASAAGAYCFRTVLANDRACATGAEAGLCNVGGAAAASIAGALDFPAAVTALPSSCCCRKVSFSRGSAQVFVPEVTHG